MSEYEVAGFGLLEAWINNLSRKILDGLSADEKVKRYFEEFAA